MSTHHMRCHTCRRDETISGTQQQVNYLFAHRGHSLTEVCQTCRGSGNDPNTDEHCAGCEGSGAITDTTHAAHH